MHDRLLAGFERFDVAVDGVRIAGRSAGSGPPVLLLHGDPQARGATDAG
jgi:haloacetate dehalogenase